MGLLYFSLFLRNSAAAPVCKGLAWTIQAKACPRRQTPKSTCPNLSILERSENQ
jgi:hypothetical protein